MLITRRDLLKLVPLVGIVSILNGSDKAIAAGGTRWEEVTVDKVCPMCGGKGNLEVFFLKDSLEPAYAHCWYCDKYFIWK